MQAKAKDSLLERWQANTKEDAEKAFDNLTKSVLESLAALYRVHR